MSMLSFINYDSKWSSVRGCESVQACCIYGLFICVISFWSVNYQRRRIVKTIDCYLYCGWVEVGCVCVCVCHTTIIVQ